MAIVKRFDGTSYTLESSGGSATITLGKDTTDAVVISGDLTVSGTTTTVNTDNLSVEDNTIILNSGETGPGITHVDGTAGIEIDRGPGTDNAFLIFDESDDTWKVDNGDGVTGLVEIATSASGTFLTAVADDPTPLLAGTLDTGGNIISAPNNNNIPLTTTGTGNIVLTVDAGQEIQLNGAVMLQGAAPTTAPAGTEVALFKGSDTGGGTEIHFETSTGTDELVSKTKAITYGLIF